MLRSLTYSSMYQKAHYVAIRTTEDIHNFHPHDHDEKSNNINFVEIRDGFIHDPSVVY